MCNCGKTKSKGSCSSCKTTKTHSIKTNGCTPALTGDIFYDGTESLCDTNDSLSLTEKRALNEILVAFKNTLCVLSTPDIYAAAEIQEAFSTSMSPCTGSTITIEFAGKYRISGLVNYRHHETAGTPILYCEGNVGLMIDGVEVSHDGVTKILMSELNAASSNNNTLVAPVFHYAELTAGAELAVGIKSADATKKYEAMGSELYVQRVVDFEDQSSD